MSGPLESLTTSTKTRRGKRDTVERGVESHLTRRGFTLETEESAHSDDKGRTLDGRRWCRVFNKGPFSRSTYILNEVHRGI